LPTTSAGGSITPFFSQRSKVRLLTESNRATAASVSRSLGANFATINMRDDITKTFVE
jgi:hypothetical protein